MQDKLLGGVIRIGIVVFAEEVNDGSGTVLQRAMLDADYDRMVSLEPDEDHSFVSGFADSHAEAIIDLIEKLGWN